MWSNKLSSIRKCTILDYKLNCISKISNLRNFVSTTMKKNLAIFDFDHTVVDDNTDIVIRNMLDKSLITDEVKQLYKSTGWTNYMQEIFKLCHHHGHTADNIKEKISQIPEVPGMINCIRTLASSNFDVLVISDSNSEFIRIWTDENKLTDHIHTVFTNPGTFDQNGLLIIQPYHHQTECQLSSENLCKGKIMEDFIKNCRQLKDIHYSKVYYMGDGRNDICPMLRIRNGYACPRIGYYCSKELENVIEKNNHSMQAEIQRWTDGFDLLEFMLATRDN